MPVKRVVGHLRSTTEGRLVIVALVFIAVIAVAVGWGWWDWQVSRLIEVRTGPV